jgi:adenylylsulfate kinase
MLIQLTGLSGAGKTTVAIETKSRWLIPDIPFIIIDGDVYRKTISRDLGFSREDRCENIRRLGKIAFDAAINGIAIIAAINPYHSIRQELKNKYQAKTVWIHCPMEELHSRDTKGLYHRALLPDGDAGKVYNLSGVNDPYEAPEDADLVIHTDKETVDESAGKLLHFILHNMTL